jgi:hypothetical protein
MAKSLGAAKFRVKNDSQNPFTERANGYGIGSRKAHAGPKRKRPRSGKTCSSSP